MNKAFFRFCSVALLSFEVLVGATHLQAQEADAIGPFRTQTFELEAGWNAVYLEVEPLETDPNVLFEETPIEIVASYLRPVGTQQFVEGPSEVLGDPKGWNVWYRPGRADELLTDLYDIQAHSAYLIYSESAYTWELNGTPFYATANWHPHAYSLVGFPIDAAQAPTIGRFFEGVSAHGDLKVYTLKSGNWTLVTEPASTLMQPGTAYWTHSEGGSDFQGPLQIDFNSESIGGLVYNINATSKRLVITNSTPYPQALEMTLVPGATGTIPLAYEVLQVNGEENSVSVSSEPFGELMEIGALEAGQSLVLELEVRQTAVTQQVMTTTLVIASDAGVRIEVPIVSVRQDLEN